MNHPNLKTLTGPIRAIGLLLAGSALLLAACNGDAENTTTTPTSTPTAPASPTAEGTPLPTGTPEGSDAAGGGIEPANPDEPPTGDLNAGDESVELGLGTYCWSPPTGSGRPALCADAIGVITAAEDLAVSPGDALEVTGDLTWPPMAIAYATLWDAPAEPLATGDNPREFRAWQPGKNERPLTFDDHSVTLPDDLEPGRYLLAINYSAGPDRGSEATYGAILVVE